MTIVLCYGTSRKVRVPNKNCANKRFTSLTSNIKPVVFSKATKIYSLPSNHIGLIETISFSSCGLYVIVNHASEGCNCASRDSVVPISQEHFSYAEEQGFINPIEANIPDRLNSDVGLSSHSIMTPFKLRPGQILRGSHIHSSQGDETTRLVSVAATDDNSLEISLHSVKEEAISAPNCLLEIVSLPENHLAYQTMVTMTVPGDDSNTIRVILDKHSSQSYDMKGLKLKRDFPAVIDREASALRYQDPRKRQRRYKVDQGSTKPPTLHTAPADHRIFGLRKGETTHAFDRANATISDLTSRDGQSITRLLRPIPKHHAPPTVAEE